MSSRLPNFACSFGSAGFCGSSEYCTIDAFNLDKAAKDVGDGCVGWLWDIEYCKLAFQPVWDVVLASSRDIHAGYIPAKA